MAGSETPPTEGPTWVVEIGSGGAFAGFDAQARAFMQAVGEKGPGGVFVPPPPMGGEQWRTAWQGAAKALGVRAWTVADRRASSRVEVTGLGPGEAVVLKAPWLAPVGTFADADGRAELDLWYAGPAELVLGGSVRRVELRPDRWTGTRREDRALRLP
jgi:hypothetical protein